MPNRGFVSSSGKKIKFARQRKTGTELREQIQELLSKYFSWKETLLFEFLFEILTLQKTRNKDQKFSDFFKFLLFEPYVLLRSTCSFTLSMFQTKQIQ